MARIIVLTSEQCLCCLGLRTLMVEAIVTAALHLATYAITLVTLVTAWMPGRKW
jgi:hypothetical protein